MTYNTFAEVNGSHYVCRNKINESNFLKLQMYQKVVNPGHMLRCDEKSHTVPALQGSLSDVNLD